MADNSTAKRARDANDNTQEDERPAKRMIDIDDFDNIVTVLVGHEERRFMLHQDAVCAKSKFFKAACSKKWREGQEKLVRLPKVDPTTFKAYCGWIYSGETFKLTCTEHSSRREMTAEDRQLIKLYLLGDILDDVQLRNRTLPLFAKSVQNHRQLLGSSSYSRIYSSTLPGSPLRRTIVEIIVSRACRKDFGTNASRYPPELMQEVALAALAAAPLVDWDIIHKRIKACQEDENAD